MQKRLGDDLMVGHVWILSQETGLVSDDPPPDGVR